MGLFNKRNRRLFFISACVAVFSGPLFFLLKAATQKPVAQPREQQLNTLLKKADSAISLSPGFALQAATHALELAQEQHSDLHKVRSWILLGRIHTLQAKHAEALSFFKKAVQLSAGKKFTAEQCEAMIKTGEVLYKNGNYDAASEWFIRADSLASLPSLKQVRAYAWFYIGKYNQTKGNFALAKQYYLKAMAVGRSYQNEKLKALVLPSLGKNYISEGNLQLALTSYQEAYYTSTHLNDALLSADICNHLGSLHLKLKEFDKAMHWHRRALAYRLMMSYPDGIAKSYNNVGKVFYELGFLDSAMHYFNRSLTICKEIHYKKGHIKALDNLGKVYVQKQQTAAAARCFSEAFNIASHAGYDIGTAESSLDLGNLYAHTGQYNKAIQSYNISLNTLLKTNLNDMLLETYKGLYECYELKKDYKRALTYHVKMLDTEKKLLNVENKRQLALLNITFDTERKEKDFQVLLTENALKASSLKKNRIALWLVAAVLSFTVLLCLYIYNRFYLKKKANRQLEDLNYRVTRQNEELELLNRELEQVSREKDKLFSIIAHELRNPLYWLQNLSEVLSLKYQTMTPEKIRKSLLSLDESAKNVYHLMDNLLHWSRSKLNRIHPRKSVYDLRTLVSETTQMYESFFKQKEISFHNDLPKEIQIHADADLFGCVVRNLVSNTIKYTPNGGNVRINCKLSGATVTLAVHDSGKGMSSADLEAVFVTGASHISVPGLMQEKGSGLGLKLCRDFVEMNEGKIWAHSIPDQGTSIFFTVPLHNALQHARTINNPEEIFAGSL